MIARERQRIRVDLGDERSYDVVIGRGAVDELLTIDARTFIVLYDTAVEALAQEVLTALGSRVVARARPGRRRRRENVGIGRGDVRLVRRRARRPRHGGDRDRRRHRYRSGRVRRGDVSARLALVRGSDHAAGRGRCRGRRKDGDQPRRGEKPRRRVPPSLARGHRYRHLQRRSIRATSRPASPKR